MVILCHRWKKEKKTIWNLRTTPWPKIKLFWATSLLILVREIYMYQNNPQKPTGVSAQTHFVQIGLTHRLTGLVLTAFYWITTWPKHLICFKSPHKSSSFRGESNLNKVSRCWHPCQLPWVVGVSLYWFISSVAGAILWWSSKNISERLPRSQSHVGRII